MRGGIRMVKKIEKGLVLDPANVMAMGKVIEDGKCHYLFNLAVPFRVLGNGCLEDNITFDGYNSKFTLSDGSTYSVEYLNKAKNVAKHFIGSINLNIYQAWDIKKKRFLKDHPVMLRNDNLGFVIAPRIERDEK
jgi:hypothetical protein